VLETWTEGEGADRPPAEGPGQPWQGTTLPLVCLRRTLGLAPLPASARRVKLVLAGTDARAVVEADAIAGLVEAAEDEFQPLPPLLAPAAHLFDGVLGRPVDGWQLLRLAPDRALSCPEESQR
jgi:chemotaxis signal transduction protein